MMVDVVLKEGSVTAPKGFLAGAAKAGIKKAGRYDLAIVYSPTLAVMAGIFTTNKVKAASVLLSQAHLSAGGGQGRGVVFNSGYANACTGEQGKKDAAGMAKATAAALGCGEEEVLVASTGLIGACLPMEKVLAGVTEAAANMSLAGGSLAAQAIMTTDTVPKEIGAEIEVAGHKVTFGAMAKGSGMIHPNMATLMCLVTTDCAIAPELLREALTMAADATFNMVTIDGDTSTNDCLLALANGMAGNPTLRDAGDPGYAAFVAGLTEVCRHLAQRIAKDGEGATKFLTVRVEGAKTERDARLAAKAVAGSSLVKTAIYGEDANWGRIICALGYSGADFDPNIVDMYLGELQVMRQGQGVAFDEAAAKAYLSGDEIVALARFHQGEAAAVAWGCDLTNDYIAVNANYRS
ncbi:MAG: bifunctional glutamate N-acetyltransferase/amino-acid acetyltransferase ArgJ [Peptococcaceae bacterium]|nr:bifunctional glutamate N-acetyltransferase/amino-acid acetyltransferase ArgJ [Peptococcaceae bacterium]